MVHAYKKKQPNRKDELTLLPTVDLWQQGQWFIYKLHLAVDTASELPMALSITPAHDNDGNMALCNDSTGCCPHRTNVKFFVLDAGYDQLKNYESVRNVRAQAIITTSI